MDSWTTSIRAAILIYPTIAILLVLPYAVFHYRRSGYMSLNRFVVFYLFVFYLICAFFLTLLPMPEIVPDFCAIHAQHTRPRLIPFYFIYLELDKAMNGFSIGALMNSFGFASAILNIVMTIPFGFFLRYLYGLSARQVLFWSFGLSFFFELTQLTGVYGLYPCPYRLFEVDDLMLNTAGGMLGYWIAGFLIPSLPNVREDHPPAAGEVTPVRRFLAFAVDLMGIALILAIVFRVQEKAFPTNMWIELAVMICWFVLIPAIDRGQTIGKRVLRIRLVSENGEPAPWTTLLTRYSIFLFVPFALSSWLAHLEDIHPGEDWYHEIWWIVLILWFSLTAGLIWLGKGHRGIHDRFSKSRYVVDE